ncbi:hypothetical protein [Methylopila sp. M107]|uniref:hypothetical protein n=1 Tax=Methylopila sp. M107 TaxID=1101190 RepID=UPI000374BFB6|nr:hypothetical protein [Methylopila sp. M107]
MLTQAQRPEVDGVGMAPEARGLDAVAGVAALALFVGGAGGQASSSIGNLDSLFAAVLLVYMLCGFSRLVAERPRGPVESAQLAVENTQPDFAVVRERVRSRRRWTIFLPTRKD